MGVSLSDHWLNRNALEARFWAALRSSLKDAVESILGL
jgi:hypothetical protein